jgi:hypothetical protein
VMQKKCISVGWGKNWWRKSILSFDWSLMQSVIVRKKKYICKRSRSHYSSLGLKKRIERYHHIYGVFITIFLIFPTTTVLDGVTHLRWDNCVIETSTWDLSCFFKDEYYCIWFYINSL